MSRKGARCDWGSAFSIFGVLENLSCISKRVLFSGNRNPRRCDSNCAISLMISSNPGVQVSSRSPSCGQLSSMLFCWILCTCCRILLSAIGITSVGSLSSISVRRRHMRLWEFRCFPRSDWVAIGPSFCSSHGARAKNSAILPQPSAVRGPLGILVVMGFLPISAYARGAYLGMVSPSCPFGMPFEWPLQRDGVVERDELCAWVCCQSLCSWLVASVVDAVVFCPSLAAGLVRVSTAVLVALARVVPRAPSPAQVRGPCWPACVLPRGDGFMQARERAQDVVQPFLPEYRCDAPPVVLHGS